MKFLVVTWVGVDLDSNNVKKTYPYTYNIYIYIYIYLSIEKCILPYNNLIIYINIQKISSISKYKRIYERLNPFVLWIKKISDIMGCHD